ncbi:MAG TPA: GTP-sensing pleiotropic transcriptional regulator CodY [Clostridia bacterium]|nr:GTP-sensing pleiotropic transcriptional regulator CodY [Clostridia bacterium]
MSESLLSKTRRLNKIIQRSGSDPVRFSDLARVLSEILHSNIFIASRRGRILGYALADEECFKSWGDDISEMSSFTQQCNSQFLKFNETLANINLEKGCHIVPYAPGDDPYKFTSIVPISCGGDRLGTLIIERMAEEYCDDDLVLAEYSATIIGMEIINAKAVEIEKEAREKTVVQMAVRTLSYSELEAIEHILNELNGNEGLLVASKIADRVGITRSVIVNALRKLESASVIESRSLGMKGTHIRVLNDKLMDEIERNR